jgi:hypothetical protein
VTCEVFIGHLFLARDVAHSAHLNTRSYAKHKALGKFYSGVIDLTDTFAETYMGRHGMIGAIALQSAKKTNNILDFLEDSLKDIEDLRYKVCDKDETAIQNIIDEIVALYLRTIYQLKFLG